MLEVEVKAPCRDPGQKLLDLGAEKVGVVDQEDIYFNSPWRDFKKSDEALRVRKTSDGFFLTYKGPRFDSETKTREELEIPVGDQIIEVLKKIGFTEAAVVRKRRELFRLGEFTICVDIVEDLGEFIEIESKDYNKKDELFELLEKLGIKKEASITKSYVELLEEGW